MNSIYSRLQSPKVKTKISHQNAFQHRNIYKYVNIKAKGIQEYLINIFIK